MTSYVRKRLPSVILFVLGLAAVWLLMSLVAAVRAYADTGAPPAEPLDLQTKLAIWAAGLHAVGRAVLAVLQVIAPRTSTKLDDEARDMLSEILTHVRPTDAPPKTPQAGRVGMWPLIIMAGAAIGVASQAMWFTGCATAERAGGAAKVAALDCGKPQLATAAALVARWGVEAAIAGKVDWGKIETDAAGFGLGVGSCAYAEFLRAWRARPVPQALAVAAPPDREADGTAGLERLRAKIGGAQIRLADGTVL